MALDWLKGNAGNVLSGKTPVNFPVNTQKYPGNYYQPTAPTGAATQPAAQQAPALNQTSGVSYQNAPMQNAATPMQSPMQAPTQNTGGMQAPTESPYASLYTMLDNHLAQGTSGINDIASQQQAGITESVANQKNAMQGYYSNADLQRQNAQSQITQNKTKNLQDLYNNVRNQYQAANTYLGTRGASDSSGADQYGYAIQKEGNKVAGDIMGQASGQQANVQNQYSQMINTLDMKKADLDNLAQQQTKQISDWKSQQLYDLQNQISSNREQLKQTDIDQYYARLSQIESAMNNYQQAIQQWALNRNAQLDDMKIQLANSGNFNSTGVTSSELNTLPQWNYQTMDLTPPQYLK